MIKKIAVIADRGFTLDKELPHYGDVVFLLGDNKDFDKAFREKVGVSPVVTFKLIHLMDNKIDFDQRFFFVRTREMIDNADEVWLFSSNKTETKFAADYAKRKGKEVRTFT